MKYIKIYENYDYLIKLLADHLLNFLSEFSTQIIMNRRNSSEYFKYFYHQSTNYYKTLFVLTEFPYKFDISVDISVLQNSNKEYVPNDIIEAIIFIYSTIVKHETENTKIKYTDIPKIINEINKEDFELRIASKKYNL